MKLSRHDPLQWLDDELGALDRADLRRRIGTRRGPQQAVVVGDQGELINFGSNDYLGLSSDPRLIAAASVAAGEAGWGAAASPLVTGQTTQHQRLERRLAEFMGTASALVFSSGYAANLGTIAALAGRGDAIYADQDNHASMIDGCRLSRADVHVFPHRDCGRLRQLLSESASYRRRLIVTESLFSMAGDRVPLADLAELARRFDGMLLIDEAHAIGVLGENGQGLVEELAVEDGVHVRIGTLSKALGSSGGFVCGSESLVEWLRHRARSYVFSTALPPAVCAAACEAIEIVEREPSRRARLAAHAASAREECSRHGWQTGDSHCQIIPLAVGDAAQAIKLSSQLRESGLLVPAIRPPSVAPGRAILRISVSSEHTPEMLLRLTSELAIVRGVV